MEAKAYTGSIGGQTVDKTATLSTVISMSGEQVKDLQDIRHRLEALADLLSGQTPETGKNAAISQVPVGAIDTLHGHLRDAGFVMGDIRNQIARIERALQ